MSGPSGFLTKTFEIFSNLDYEDLCGWGPKGDTIYVRKIEEFSKQILPKYFKHANFQSFVRQLNMYDFHKTVQDPNNGEFQHVYFRKDRPDLLAHIKRKANSRQEANRKLRESNSPVRHIKNETEEIGIEYETVSSEIIAPQKHVRDDFERRIKDMEMQMPRLLEVEKKQSRLIGENSMLKQYIFEQRHKQAVTQERLDHILKLLYGMYVAAKGGTLQRSLGSDNRVSLDFSGTGGDAFMDNQFRLALAASPTVINSNPMTSSSTSSSSAGSSMALTRTVSRDSNGVPFNLSLPPPTTFNNTWTYQQGLSSISNIPEEVFLDACGFLQADIPTKYNQSKSQSAYYNNSHTSSNSSTATSSSNQSYDISMSTDNINNININNNNNNHTSQSSFYRQTSFDTAASAITPPLINNFTSPSDYQNHFTLDSSHLTDPILVQQNSLPIPSYTSTSSIDLELEAFDCIGSPPLSTDPPKNLEFKNSGVFDNLTVDIDNTSLPVYDNNIFQTATSMSRSSAGEASISLEVDDIEVKKEVDDRSLQINDINDNQILLPSEDILLDQGTNGGGGGGMLVRQRAYDSYVTVLTDQEQNTLNFTPPIIGIKREPPSQSQIDNNNNNNNDDAIDRSDNESNKRLKGVSLKIDEVQNLGQSPSQRDGVVFHGNNSSYSRDERRESEITSTESDSSTMDYQNSTNPDSMSQDQNQNQNSRYPYSYSTGILPALTSKELDQLPLIRLDSLESTLASLLDYNTPEEQYQYQYQHLANTISIDEIQRLSSLSSSMSRNASIMALPDEEEEEEEDDVVVVVVENGNQEEVNDLLLRNK